MHGKFHGRLAAAIAFSAFATSAQASVPISGAERLSMKAATCDDARTFGDLTRIATRSLERNILRFGGHGYVVAGQHQFKTLWTRDFAWSVRGLLALGHGDVVRHHLTKLIGFRREGDALIPRTLDSMDAKVRVVLNTLVTIFRIQPPDLPFEPDVHAEYLGENNTIAIDGNILVLQSALDYAEATQDWAWWREQEPALVHIYKFYERHLRDGLVEQPGYSDWQDSVAREGKTFYTNLLYYTVSRRLARFEAFTIDSGELARMRSRIEVTFRDLKTGLYLSVAGFPQISLDGNLFALDSGFLPEGSREARVLYAALARHPLFRMNGGIPGFFTFPNYPSSWVSGTTRFIGLEHYHDELYWSQLMAYSAKVAAKMGDVERAVKTFTALEWLAVRDGWIGEIYASRRPFKLFESWGYKSEAPFSWGAAATIEALDSLDCVSQTPPPVLRDGLFKAVRSNDPSTCPQRIRAEHRDGKLTAIHVVYSGDCADQGPYVYYCNEASPPVCSWNNESFEVHSPDSYTWRNHAHNIWGFFEHQNQIQ